MKASPGLKFERRAGHPTKVVAGVDEVGRGCLAGPVTAAVVILPPKISYKKDPWLSDIGDSKLLTAKKREELVPLIEGWALGCAVASASVEEIDRINIYHASHLAMARALELAISRLKERDHTALVHHVLVDGNVIPKAITLAATAVVKGDMQCLSIAAASILAKVWRDQRMAELDSQYPGYHFAAHKGYGTPEHSKALLERGPCDIHRRSFEPVAQLLRQAEPPAAEAQGVLL